MVGKLFHSSNSELKDNSKIHFSQPKIDKNGLLKSEAYYMEEGKPKIEYQTKIGFWCEIFGHSFEPRNLAIFRFYG